MRIRGLVFAGSATDRRGEMAAFAADALGLTPDEDPSVEADLFRHFRAPDGQLYELIEPRRRTRPGRRPRGRSPRRPRRGG